VAVDIAADALQFRLMEESHWAELRAFCAKSAQLAAVRRSSLRKKTRLEKDAMREYKQERQEREEDLLSHQRLQDELDQRLNQRVEMLGQDMLRESGEALRFRLNVLYDVCGGAQVYDAASKNCDAGLIPDGYDDY
jgi:hypothetical protein